MADRVANAPRQWLSPHDRMPYSAIIDRPAIQWPNDAKVAFWVAPNIEVYDFIPPPGQARQPWPGRLPPPNVRQYSYRDYGNRVGFWRMLEVLDDFGIRCTAAANLAIFDEYPSIGSVIRARNWAVMS